MRGGFSGGTFASGLATMAAAQKDPAVGKLLADPFALTTGFHGPAQPDGDHPYEDKVAGSWVVPFMMAGINTKAVHRTNFLLGHPWGEDFQYDEMLMVAGPPTGAPLQASRPRQRAAAQAGRGSGTKEEREARLLRTSCSHPPRKLDEHRGPRTGEGRHVDPGYGSTSKMLGEAALALAFDVARETTPPGCWTPASAMGEALLKRLPRPPAITFEVEGELKRKGILEKTRMSKRIGVIGLGQRIAHVLAAMDEVGWTIDLAGYADPSPVGLPILAEAGIRAGRAYRDEAELLADGPFDLIMIGTPNHLHRAHLDAAFAAGFPVFSEKPIVRTAEESFDLARTLAAGTTPPLFIGLVMRSMPLVREVIARADAGELGDLHSRWTRPSTCTPSMGQPISPPGTGGRRKAEWGGSFMLDKVCHDFDIFARLARSRAMRVASFGGRRIFTPDQTDLPKTYEDGAAAYAQRDAGWMGANDAFHSDMDLNDHQVAIAHYESGLALAFHSNSHVSLQERRWYIVGTRGTLLADLVRNKLMVRPSLHRGKPERIDFATRTADLHNGADQAMAIDLLAALDEEKRLPRDAAEDSLEAGLTGDGDGRGG